MVRIETCRPVVVELHAALCVAGAVGIGRLRHAPLPVAVGAALAAAAGLTAFVHLTGVVPCAGATGLLPHAASPPARAAR
jgi:hypothetical protein